MNAIEAAAREFTEWLHDRLPETIMPSRGVALQDARDALTAILRKHFPPAGIAEQCPKLIESGPLPAGRLIFGQVEVARGVYKRQVRWLGIDGTWADNQRACGWKFYDYGPLPPPPGVEP